MARSAEEIPIRITPVLACQWRWLNTSALACQLDDKTTLQPSQQYHLTVQPGQTGQTEQAGQAILKTTDGKILAEPYEHSFTTERARVRSAYFRTWKAPGWPVIRLVFDQPVSQESVAQHVFLIPDQTMTDSAENRTTPRYPITVQADPEDQKLARFFRVPGENYWLDFGDPANRKSRKNQKSADDLTDMNGEEARRVWLVSPQSELSLAELSLDTGMQLWAEPGIESALGPERSVDSRMVVEFHTFPEFCFSWGQMLGQKRRAHFH